MVDVLFRKGKEEILGGNVDFDGSTISGALLGFGTTDTGIKAVSGATNATPIVVTATSHGFANGDLVYVNGIVGNEAANGLWRIANIATNTFELTRFSDGVNAAGSGAYSSGGYAVCLGPSAAGDNWDNFSAAIVGAKVNLTGKTILQGVADCDDIVFPNVTGSAVDAVGIFEDTGTESTSTMISLHTGRQLVTCSITAASSATAIDIEPLRGGIPNGTDIYFSNGQVATLTAAANAGDRTLTVSSLSGSVTVNSVGLAPITGNGFPVTPNGGSITFQVDNGPRKLFVL